MCDFLLYRKLSSGAVPVGDFYLCQGDYVFVQFCMCVCVCVSVCVPICKISQKVIEPILMKFHAKVDRATRRNWLDFGGDPAHSLDLKFLGADHSWDSGIFKRILCLLCRQPRMKYDNLLRRLFSFNAVLLICRHAIYAFCMTGIVCGNVHVLESIFHLRIIINIYYHLFFTQECCYNELNCCFRRYHKWLSVSKMHRLI